MPPKSKAKVILDIKEAAKANLTQDIDYAVKKEHINRAFPSVAADELEAMIPKPHFDEFWTRAKETALRKEWQEDPRRQAMLQTTNKKPALWKTCALVMRCLPTDIIGPKTNLVVDTSSNHEGALHWPDRLCQGLTKLLPHPMFQCNPRHLAIAIQYTIICCTEDCRPWPLENTSGDAFLEMFCQTIKYKQGGNIPAKALRKSARRRFKRNYPDGTPSFWYELFLSIEGASENARAVDREPVNKENQVVHYTVKVDDLKILIAALDNMTHKDLTVFHSKDVVHSLCQTARTSDDLPKDNDGSLWKAHDSALLAERRDEKLNMRPELEEESSEEEESFEEEEDL